MHAKSRKIWLWSNNSSRWLTFLTISHYLPYVTYIHRKRCDLTVFFCQVRVFSLAGPCQRMLATSFWLLGLLKRRPWVFYQIALRKGMKSMQQKEQCEKERCYCPQHGISKSFILLPPKNGLVPEKKLVAIIRIRYFLGNTCHSIKAPAKLRWRHSGLVEAGKHNCAY